MDDNSKELDAIIDWVQVTFNDIVRKKKLLGR